MRRNPSDVAPPGTRVGGPGRYVPRHSGIAAAIGPVAYLPGAVIGHLRVGDTTAAAMPVLPLVPSIAVLVLRLVTS